MKGELAVIGEVSRSEASGAVLRREILTAAGSRPRKAPGARVSRRCGGGLDVSTWPRMPSTASISWPLASTPARTAT